MNVIKEASKDLLLSESEFRILLRSSYKEIKHQKIPKKAGGNRTIHIPPQPAKLLQYWIIKNILINISTHPAATAYIPGGSIVKNAKTHKNNLFFIRLDFSDFFGSIKAGDFFEAMKQDSDDPKSSLVGFSDHDCDLKKALFPPTQSCGIGYPISPYICNIVMKDFDHSVTQWLESESQYLNNPRYTRYADDMVISYNNKNATRYIITEIEKIIKNTDRPKLKLNYDKTKLGNRRAGSAQVTGLRITPDGRVTLQRKQKDHIRLLVKLAEKKGKLEYSEWSSLVGYLNFCRFADPDFYTKLVTRHFSTLKNIID